MSVMQPCPDGEFDWIRSGREELLPIDAPNWRGNFVSHLLPPRFDSYAKILHRIEARYENIDNRLSAREISLLEGPSCMKLRSFVESLREQRRGPRIKWKTLAQLLRVPFEPEICHEWFRASLKEPACWPRFLYGPAEGNLNAEEVSEVVSVLRRFTGDQDCFFRFSAMPFIPSDRPILFRGVLEEIVSFLRDGKYKFTPEYWWPADYSWCLCTDYDLMFTVVAGPKNLISAVFSSPTLEVLEMSRQTRIDFLAPIPK